MKGKQHSVETKEKAIKEAIETGNCSLVGRRYNIATSVVSRWVQEYKARQAGLPKKTNSGKTLPYNPDEYKKAVSENDQLKKLLGEKDLEIAILRELLKKTNPALKIK